MHLEFVSYHPLAAGGIKAGDFGPIQLGNEISDGLPLHVRLKGEEPSNGLVAIEDPSILIHHEHTIFDSVEKRFEKGSLAGQALNDSLQALGIEAVDATE